jgi:hypothetical protein
VFDNFCIWLRIRNWKRLILGSAITYMLMLVGVLGADLIQSAKPPQPPAMIGYVLLVSSYAATAAVWSMLREPSPRREE